MYETVNVFKLKQYLPNLRVVNLWGVSLIVLPCYLCSRYLSSRTNMWMLFLRIVHIWNACALTTAPRYDKFPVKVNILGDWILFETCATAMQKTKIIVLGKHKIGQYHCEDY